MTSVFVRPGARQSSFFRLNLRAHFCWASRERIPVDDYPSKHCLDLRHRPIGEIIRKARRDVTALVAAIASTMLFGLGSEKPLLNRFQLAQPQRAQGDGTFDHKGNQSIALVLEDFDRAGEMFRPGSVQRSVCVYQET